MVKIKDDIKTFTLRLTPKEHEILERGAKEKRVSKNQFIVDLLNSYNDFGEIRKHLKEVDTRLTKLEQGAQKK